MTYVQQAFQAWDINGNPLSNGFLFTYMSGTNIPLPTYTLYNGNYIENPWPADLNVLGSPENFFLVREHAPYRFNVFDVHYAQVPDFPVDGIAPGTIQAI